MGYGQAIVLPKKDKDGFVLFTISFLLTLILSLIVAFVVFLIPYEFYVKFKIEEIFDYKHLIYVSIFSTSYHVQTFFP